MPPVLIIELNPISNTLLGLCNGVVGLEIDFLVFQAAPEPFNKHIIHPAALAVHADSNALVLEDIGKAFTGELAALVTVEDIRRAMAIDGLPLDKRQLSTFLEHQSMIATKYRKPLRIGI